MEIMVIKTQKNPHQKPAKYIWALQTPGWFIEAASLKTVVTGNGKSREICNAVVNH